MRSLLPYAVAVPSLLLCRPGRGFQLPRAPRSRPPPPPSRLGSAVAEGAAEATPPPIAAPAPDPDPDAAAAAPAAPDLRAYAAGYKTAFRELPCARVGVVAGADDGASPLPPDLAGTYYKAGPAMFSAGSLPPPRNSLVKPKGPPVPDGADPGRMVAHPFEGDGAVLAVTFHGGRAGEEGHEDADRVAVAAEDAGSATARFRYVRTNAFTNERKKGKRLYSGMDGTRDGGGPGSGLPLPFLRHHLLPGLNKARKNTSNTRAFYFGSRLVTLWAGGLPYKLDALALSTEGRTQLGGAVPNEEAALGAAARVDPVRNRALFFGVEEAPGASTLRLYEFNARFRPIEERGGVVSAKLPGLALVYDFAATDGHALFVQPRLRVNAMQYLLSKEPGKCVELEEAPALLHIVGRPGNKQKAGAVITLEIPYDGVPEANLQFVNAYEEDDGTFVFDAIRSDGGGSGGAGRWPWASTPAAYRAAAAGTSLWRYRADPRGAGSVTKERLSAEPLHFATVNPAAAGRAHRYVYAAAGAAGEDAAAPPQGLVRLDLAAAGGKGGAVGREAWFPAAHEFCGEPVYARRQGGDEVDGTDGDDGYVVATLFDGREESSSIVVLRANNLAAGPVARIPLGMAVPHGYHGCFVPTADACWSHEEIERRAKLADKMEARGSMWNEVKSDFSGLGLRFDDMEEYFGDLM